MTASDLKGIRACHSKVRSLQQRVDRLRCAMYSPASPVLSHAPHGGGISDPTAKAAVTIAQMELRLLEMIIDLEQRIEAVEVQIAKMPWEDQQIIRERYVNGLSWRQVARACNRSIDNCFTRHRKIMAKLDSK